MDNIKNMEIPTRYNDIIATLKKYYIARDSSHGFEHVEKVCKNALYIYNTIQLTTEKKHDDELILVISSLGHDIWDHKYFSDSDEIDKIKSLFMYSMFICDVSSAIIFKSIKIIDSISLSNEYRLRQEGKQLELDPEIIFIRNIVSDADKLESLGLVCVERMIEYGIHNKIIDNAEHFQHIKLHCQTKLYRLLHDNYITTDIGRRLAEPLLQELKNIVDNDDILRETITQYIDTRLCV